MTRSKAMDNKAENAQKIKAKKTKQNELNASDKKCKPNEGIKTNNESKEEQLLKWRNEFNSRYQDPQVKEQKRKYMKELYEKRKDEIKMKKKTL